MLASSPCPSPLLGGDKASPSPRGEGPGNKANSSPLLGEGPGDEASPSPQGEGPGDKANSSPLLGEGPGDEAKLVNALSCCWLLFVL